MRRILAVTVGLLALVGALLIGTGGARDEAPREAAGAPQPRGERARGTPTPTPAPRRTRGDVLAAIDDDDALRHLRGLAATARGGTRAAGTPGDRATREYIAGALRRAGWRVRTQRVGFPFFEERRPPSVAAGGGALPSSAVRTLAYSPGGTVTGRVRPVRLALGRASDSGCRPSDFSALRTGDVALVQRGTCTMRRKAELAQRAGAAAVLVVNDGVAGRTDPIPGTLGSPGLRVPVVFLGTAAGRRVAEAGRVSVRVDATSERRWTANVLAEIGTGEDVVMAGAHLDSVTDGPGMNDNASGVSALLAAAEAIGPTAPRGVRLRLGFWGAEELGLYGSRRYVRDLDAAGRAAVRAYVNLDMVGTPDGRMAVYQGDAGVRRMLVRALGERGVRDLGRERVGSASDHAPFARAGIAVGGLFTGLDRCYHRRCDTLGNVDESAVADAGAATAATLLELSR